MHKKVLILALLLSFLLPAFAKAVTVGPARLEYTVDPETTLKGQLFLKNEGDRDRTLYPAFQRFTEVNGEKVFTNDESDLAGWFDTLPSVSLKAGEERYIPFTIRVPKDAEPGGHFAVIWWGTAPPATDSQVSIVTRAGILVLLNVTGDIRENAELVSFDTAGGRVASRPPVTFVTLIKNQGNVALNPQGEITLKNLFGKKKDQVPLNAAGWRIFPENERSLNTEFVSTKTFFGPYRAELTMKYGADEKVIKESAWIFFFPPLKTAALLVVLLLLIFFPTLLRRYNAWIIIKNRPGA